MKVKITQFPCVKGTIGDWTYYLTVIGASEVVKYVKYAEEVCPNTALDLMIQREVESRSQQIAEYLRHNDQRFFGALIIAAYDGKPNFRPISFGETSLALELDGAIGLLQFDGNERYYAIDGQHRLAALKEVLAEDAERYENDQLSVIVICHSSDAEGMARARRLFTTVNRYAKKTSKVTNIVMDEDDGIALLTRRLIREKPFFSQRIKVLRNKNATPPRLATSDSMHRSDTEYLMAIGTFYKCNEALLPSHLKEVFARSQQIPPFESLETGYAEVADRWNALIDSVPLWERLRNGEATLQEFRHADGGNVLARPVGIASFVRASGEALENGVATAAISTVAVQFGDLASPPWNGILWNPASQNMIFGKAAEDLGTRIWRYLLGLNEPKNLLEQDWKAQIDPLNENPDLTLPLPP